VELDVACAPGTACSVVGRTRTFEAGAEADARRAERRLGMTAAVFPEVDFWGIAGAATPPPPAFDSSRGFGVGGK
jgi:hypothetical protein